MNRMDTPDYILVEVVQRFLAADTTSVIRDWLRTTHGLDATREDVYPLVRIAIDRGYFHILAPPNYEAGLRLAGSYGKSPDDVQVVNATGHLGRAQVCARAVELTLSLIKSLGEGKQCVHIGLGGGETIRQMAQLLATRLRAEAFLPKLALHAISSGFNVSDPRTAPVTFLNFFENIATDIEYHGLFAPAVVATREYKKVKRMVGVEESFKAAKHIDIILTSLATAADKHGALRQFAEVGKQGFKKGALRAAGWIGDLQYQPYSKKGPIEVDVGVRAVTLFDLRDLREFARRKNKHVVVVAGPCGSCLVPKTAAVAPLLECEELKVWTKLVLDIETAKELLAAVA